MFSTPGRKATAAVAGGAWIAGAAILVKIEERPATMPDPRDLALLLALMSLAAICTLGLVLRVRNECIARAFDLGYRAGIYDGMRIGRDAGKRVVEMPRPRATMN